LYYEKIFFPLTLFILLFGVSLISKSQKQYPPQITGAKEITFKNIDNIKLKLWVFNPQKHQISDKKPAIVFFFGGGWNGGTPSQFVKHCEYLAARGMVAIVADYRVRSRNNVRAKKCVSDAKSAIRWVRSHAPELGVDPNRIAAGGGSAGGHLAAATGTLSKFDETSENLSVSSKPNALVLFNPVLVLAPIENQSIGFEEKYKGLEARLGTKPESMSPYHNITVNVPATIIFHGTADTTVPVKTAQLFASKMKKMGNSCNLITYLNESHGFFNFGKKSNGPFIDTVNKMDSFLVSLGYLEAPPKIVENN
jgi:acetyl esterase